MQRFVRVGVALIAVGLAQASGCAFRTTTVLVTPSDDGGSDNKKDGGAADAPTTTVDECEGVASCAPSRPQPTGKPGKPGSCSGAVKPPASEALGSRCTQTFPPTKGIACGVPLFANATTYYVSAKRGDDANDGTDPSAPFASLCKAMEVAQQGSNVLVAAGEYTNAELTIRSGIAVKGGYADDFASWNPDAFHSTLYARVTLEHDDAVVGGFRMIGRATSSSNGEVFHRIAAGTLIRNYVEVVYEATAEAWGTYAIVAASPAGSTSTIACNDIYTRLSGGTAILDAIEYGNVASHSGTGIVDRNRVCNDSVDAHVAQVVAGYGNCDDKATSPARVTVTNSLLESVGRGGEVVSFYHCDRPQGIVVTLTNNTTIGHGPAIGSGGAGAQVDWLLTNNVFTSSGPGSFMTGSSVVYGMGNVTSQGNLAIGYGPATGLETGAYSAASIADVFVAAAAGDYRPKADGPAHSGGQNVYADPERGDVTVDLFGAPRPANGAWSRGAIRGD